MPYITIYPITDTKIFILIKEDIGGILSNLSYASPQLIVAAIGIIKNISSIRN